MKKAGLIGIIILLTGVIAFYLLWSKPSSSVQLVKFIGVESAANLSKGYFDWMSFNDSAQLNAIPAQKNDLIYFIFGDGDNDDKAYIMRNLKPSDKAIKITFDSVGTYIDERLVSLSIHKDNIAVDQWLSQSSKADLQHLQMLWISDTITENNLQQLKKIGASNSTIGLIMETDDPFLAQTEEIINPSWLWLTDGKVSSEMVSKWNKMDHLECMILIDVNVDQARWDGMKKLKRLHIEDPDSLSDEKLSQLPKGLTSLQISNTDLQNLNFLEGHTQLKEVSFNYCDELTNIDALTKLPHLTSISLANCDSIPGLNSLSQLKELTWFAPPANITEQELASIINNNPDLESLVLVDCDHIKSLDMLKDLEKLSFLSLVSTPLVPDSLFRFKHLKYIAYGPDDEKDTISVDRLQKQLPDTFITTAQPFCMGTGWLIMFFGLLILLTLIGVRIKNRIHV